MGNKLYVGNLPYDTNEDDLTALFAKAGSNVSVCESSNIYAGSSHDPPTTERSAESEAGSRSHSRTFPAMSKQPKGLTPRG